MHRAACDWGLLLVKVFVVVGTRPEAIKMAPVILALREDASRFEVVVCSTGQHKELLSQALESFGITPAIDLGVMLEEQSLARLSAAILVGFSEVLVSSRPDVVLVHGDTATAMACSLACFYQNVDVAHVEAGLRTYDLRSPFPEEMNRQVVGKLARWHFCPTERNRRQLLNEGVSPEGIVVTGNTVIDALRLTLDRFHSSPGRYAAARAGLAAGIGIEDDGARIVLVTGHRRENIGFGISELCEGLAELASTFPDVLFVYPVHPNPAVRSVVSSRLCGRPNVKVIAPLGYEEFTLLMEMSFLVVTDSGGIQEEAPSLAKPVLVVRNETERPEAVDAGTVRVVGNRKEQIVASVTELLTSRAAYDAMSRACNPYGDGKAAGRIASFLGARIASGAG